MIPPDTPESTNPMVHLTVRCRVADRHTRALRRMARQVNQVWNYCNETSYRAITRDGRWLHHFDFMRDPLRGTSRVMREDWPGSVHIPQTTVSEVAKEYCTRRDRARRTFLRWRGSVRHRANYSLGWVPFHGQTVRYAPGRVRFAGAWFRLRGSGRLNEPDQERAAGAFVEDAEGRWYFCVTVKRPAGDGPDRTLDAVGVSLGQGGRAGTSNGETLDPREWRQDGRKIERGLERQIDAGRRKHGQPARGLRARRLRHHRRVLNRRRDTLQKFANRVAGAASAVFLAGRAAGVRSDPGPGKSILDPAHGDLARMLVYKCKVAGIPCESAIEGEALSQTCSSCGAEAPQGIPPDPGGGGMREWECDACGAVLDRAVNAARNVLAVGLDRLAEGNRPA
ncbi:MAG: transposase [Rhodospirillaceae bacterium]|nr:transposase [Rhodospirillaceae bacterium]